MADRFVVADASPLVGLAAAGAFEVLRLLFEHVFVTAAVRDEVMAGAPRPAATELAVALAGGWISVVADGPAVFPGLGAGEASTVAAAISHDGACLALLDDAQGRARARDAAITISGTVGVLLAAKRAGLIDRVNPPLDRLVEHGFRVHLDSWQQPWRRLARLEAQEQRDFAAPLY